MASLQLQNQDLNPGTTSNKKLGDDSSNRKMDDSSVSALGSISASSIQIN